MEFVHLTQMWKAGVQGSNNDTDSDTCTELQTSNDGHLLVILGINTMIALALFTLFGFMCCYYPNFVKSSYVQRRWPNLLSREGRDIQDKEREEHIFPPTATHSAKSTCESILKFFLMGERGVRARVGPDASLYLTMELYLLILLAVFSFFSLVIMVPVNYSASNIQNTSFARTTIGNVQPGDDVLWVYNVFALIYFIISVVFMLFYSVKLGREQKIQSSHSIMIQGIPVFVHPEDLIQHLEEAIPGLEVEDVRFSYNVTKLAALWEQLKEANHQLAVAMAYKEEKGKELMVRIGFEKICICSDDNLVNALEYYESEQDRLRVAVARERAIALEEKKLNLAFVTFRTQDNAEDFTNAYKTWICICRSRPDSSLSSSIHSSWWNVSMASIPKDIIWENLSTGWICGWVVWIAVNLVLLVFVFFFSTPVVVLNSVNQLKVIFLNATNLDISSVQPSGLLQSYLASFLLTVFSALLLFIVTRSVYLEAHWSRSKRACVMLRKGFAFQIIMVLLLPTLGFTSLSAFSQLVLKQSNDSETLQEKLGLFNLYFLFPFTHINNKYFISAGFLLPCNWLSFHLFHFLVALFSLRCIYLPNNGMFFISYIIIGTFVVSPMELVRIFQFIEYLYWAFQAKTKLEKQQAVKKITTYDFMFGLQYAYCLLIFALTVTYSLSTPLITPFGTFFFLVKYYVDKYNLLFAYKPSSSSGHQNLHKTASHIVLVATLHLQIGTVLFTIVRGGSVRAVNIFLIVTFVLSSIACIGIVFFGWFSYILPYLQSFSKGYHIFGGIDDIESSEAHPDCYVASVIEETTGECPSAAPSDDSVLAQSYESFGRTMARGTKHQVLLTAGRSRQLPTQSRNKNILVEEEEEEIEVKGTKQE